MKLKIVTLYYLLLSQKFKVRTGVLIPVYLLLVYTKLPLLIPMAIMGISFSLVPAVMWPSVAYIIEESRLGTAYGLMTMIQNIGLAGFNFMIGFANDN